jgi:hypothetical protein
MKVAMDERMIFSDGRLIVGRSLVRLQASMCWVSRWGVFRNWWDVAGIDMTGQEMLTWGFWASTAAQSVSRNSDRATTISA